MLENMQDRKCNDLRTRAYVLRRTNYGEADRILSLITPEGKISAIAKGVRKEKSRLAGGVEMFSLVDINIHKGKSELFVVTSSKMLKYYGGIVMDLERMEFAGMILKKISLASENSDNADFFRIVDLALPAIDSGEPIEVVEAWFWFNLVKAIGEQVNLYRDESGEKLDENMRYFWNTSEEVLTKNLQGDISADEIKIMRLMLTVELPVILRVKNIKEKITPILRVARAIAKV